MQFHGETFSDSNYLRCFNKNNLLFEKKTIVRMEMENYELKSFLIECNRSVHNKNK